MLLNREIVYDRRIKGGRGGDVKLQVGEQSSFEVDVETEPKIYFMNITGSSLNWSKITAKSESYKTFVDQYISVENEEKEWR